MLETMQNIMGFDIYFVYSLRHIKYSGCVGVEPGVGGGGAGSPNNKMWE